MRATFSEGVTWSSRMPAPGTSGRIAASAPTPAASPSSGRRRRVATATVHTERDFMAASGEAALAARTTKERTVPVWSE